MDMSLKGLSVTILVVPEGVYTIVYDAEGFRYMICDPLEDYVPDCPVCYHRLVLDESHQDSVRYLCKYCHGQYSPRDVRPIRPPMEEAGRPWGVFALALFLLFLGTLILLMI